MSDEIHYQLINSVSSADRQSWERVRGHLRAELGDAVYNSWFARLELEQRQEDAVLLTVPTKVLKS